MQNTFADDLAAVSKIDAVSHILEVVCRATGMGFATVARVTEDHWIACAVRDEIAFGLEPGGELQVETTICDQVRDSRQSVVIDHVAEDKVYCGHPTPQMYGFQSYISVPIIRAGGRFFGTLCAIDPKPARLNNVETLGMFKLFADLVAFHLDAQERLRLSETALLDERQTAQLREQFIAVMGHDLHNPLGAIVGGADLLARMPLEEKAAQTVALILRSGARMTGLIDDVMDMARGRLGGGIVLNLVADARLGDTLQQVINELRTRWPDRSIRSEIDLNQPVRCDGARVAQLLSNLLANALTHGDSGGPVWVRARSDEEGFELSVANFGEPIPVGVINRLFQPFTRAASSARPGSKQDGLGLGLYIASEIARAHGGSLEVASSSEETRFTFRLPPSNR